MTKDAATLGYNVMPIEGKQVKIGLCSLLVSVTIILGSASTYGYIVERQTGGIKPEFHEPQEVVELYLKAVGRGELVVFDRMLNKSMLVPVSVEYVYELNSLTPRIKVYSKLKQPIPVPGQKDCELRAVSATLDADGHIIATEAHIIWPE